MKGAMQTREKIQDCLEQAESFAKHESVLCKVGVGLATSITRIVDI